MPVNYTYPTNAALTRIAPDLIQTASQDDPIFKIFPMRNRNASRLRWAQKDNYRGLMSLRGLGGEPTRINRVGDKIYEAVPGYYGNFSTVDEQEMTTRAGGNFPVDVTIPVNVGDLVAESQEQLVYLQTTRMKQIAWLLAINHTFAVPLPNGGIGHEETYTGQDVTVSPLWSATATALPLKNLRDLQGQFGFGTSNQFGAMAEAWMNSITANYLLTNSNAADLGGKRVEGGNTVNDVPGITSILRAQSAPSINIWDDGYYDEANVFQLFIPTGKVLIVAKRPNGETPGEFQITRNANNPDMGAAPYAFVDDRTAGPTKTVPPRIDVHQGFNGGPVVERASQLITMTVA